MTAILLGPGADNVTASSAGDQLYGGDGADTLTAIAGGNALYGDSGDDVLNGAAGNDYLNGGGDAIITEHNVMHGFGGDDTIISGSWGDQVFGGAGDDLVQITAMRTGQIVDGGSGTDTLMLLATQAITDPLAIHMGATFQPVAGGIGGATYANFENLYVVGGSGSNSIFGGSGDDTIMNSFSNVATFQGGQLKGGGGNDAISFYGVPASGGGTMLLDGGTGVDSLSWGNGLASFGALVVDASAGTMTADGTQFASFTRFEALNIQTFVGTTGTVAFTGGNEVDTLDLYASTSTLLTGGGNDVINLRSGQTDLHAGLGDDNVRVDFANASTQNLLGEGGNDLIQGGSGQATLSGGDGNDTLTSFNGRSEVLGGAGDDTLYLTSSYSMSGTGPAVIDGGSGRDTLTLELSLYTGTFNANFAAKSVTLSDGTQIVGVEGISFVGGTGNDSLTASNDARGYAVNKLSGVGGDDTLRASAAGAGLDGGAGNDLLLGGDGADSLNGNLGDDVLKAGAGNDTLMGYFGRDVMTGGLGADRFVFTYPTQSGNDAATRDVITDFSQTDLDHIDLSGMDADGNFSNGKTPFTFIGTAAFHGVAGEVRFHIFDKPGTAHDLTLIEGDVTGSGAASFQIELKGLIPLSVQDFLLV